MIQLQILNKVLADNDFSIIEKNGLDESYFDAYPIEYKFIKDHYERYKKVPDAVTFLDKFPEFDIIEVNESQKYLVEKIQDEHLYQVSEQILQKDDTYDTYKEFAASVIELMAELSGKSIEELLENKRVVVHDETEQADVEIKMNEIFNELQKEKEYKI